MDRPVLPVYTARLATYARRVQGGQSAACPPFEGSRPNGGHGACAPLPTLQLATNTKRNNPMKAYVYSAGGAAISDVPKPSPKGTQVLVKVHACGLNRADLGDRKSVV